MWKLFRSQDERPRLQSKLPNSRPSHSPLSRCTVIFSAEYENKKCSCSNVRPGSMPLLVFERGFAHPGSLAAPLWSFADFSPWDTSPTKKMLVPVRLRFFMVNYPTFFFATLQTEKKLISFYKANFLVENVFAKIHNLRYFCIV